MILVTGGSSGIGRSLVQALAAEGRQTVFTYRTGEEQAREVAAASGGLATARFLDLEDPEGPQRLLDDLHGEGVPVRHLVHNAGMEHSGLLAMTPDADMARVLEVNLMASLRLMRAVIPHMLRQRGGSIVALASLAALRARPGQGAYAASKAGLLAMTRTLAREMGRKRIRVNAVAPGFVATGMTSDLPPEAIADLRRHECLPDGVSLDSVVGAIRFLLSEDAASITGQCLVVDAGSSL
jgi:3-oxoacyl-[acyl-carrier protein] reductase